MKSKSFLCKLLLIFFVFFVSAGMIFGQMCGDLDGSGIRDIIDALLLAQCYVGQRECDPADIADINCDGSIDIIDALLLAQFYVGIISQLNCCGTPTVTPAPPLVLSIYIEFNPSIYPNDRHYPQFSLWIKDTVTDNLNSIYITRFAAGLSESSDNYRPYALPVWFAERVIEKTQPSYPEIDAISGATPLVANTTFTWQIPATLNNKDIEVYLEGNMSYDLNDYYTHNPNGQPSLIWMSVMNTGNNTGPIEPPVIGHGDVLGEDGLIHTEGMSEITNARDIFLRVIFEITE